MEYRTYQNLLNGEKVKAHTQGTAWMVLKTSARKKDETLPRVIDVVESIGDAPTVIEMYKKLK